MLVSSCCPNATWAFHPESFAVELHAILPIKKGEMITISYGAQHKARAERQKFLLERYKFNCTCPACVTESSKSEQARMRVVSSSKFNFCEDDQALRSWVNDLTKPDDLILSECHAMINILDEEKFYALGWWPVWYQRLVKAYCALGDRRNARKWAEKAAKLSRAYVLHDAGWDAVAKDPQNTDWWGLRVKARRGASVGETETLGNLDFQGYATDIEMFEGSMPILCYRARATGVF